MFKNTCIAAAISLAATGTWAQSGVTIYGLIDMSLARANSGTSTVVNLPGNTARLDGLTSRLGFRGQEDLGGGHAAFFHLESRFKTDTGEMTSAARFWEGRSVVGLRGPYGEVTLGRDYVPAFYPAVKSDPFGYDQTVGSVQGHQFAGYAIDAGARAANSISYKSPSMGGLTAHIAASAGEGQRSNHTGFNLEYNSGPLYLAAAHDRIDRDNRLWLLAGAYDLQVVKLMLIYANARRSPGVEGRNVTVGLTAPLAGGIAKLVYARFDPDTERGSLNAGTSRGGAQRSKFGVGYEYLLSKRTSLYAGLGTGEQDLSGLTRKTGYDIGVRHRF